MNINDLTPSKVPREPRIFYGWWIIFGGMAGMIIQNGFNFHGLNAFVLPLSETFGVSVSLVAASISFARIETAFIGPLEGYLVDRFGPKTMMLIGVPIMSAGFLLASTASSYGMFVVALLAGIVLGVSLGIHSPITTAVANWWIKKRGRAFGILWLGQSAGAAVVPIVNWLIETTGWRGAFRIMGVIVLMIGLPVAMVMRHRPEQYGLLPDGDRSPEPPELRESVSDNRDQLNTSEAEEFTPWEALRTATFWFFALSVSVRVGVTTAIAINSFPLVIAMGGTAGQASLLFLMQGVFSAPGRLFLSWVGDAINKRHIMAVSLAIMCVCLLFMAQVTTLSQLYIVWIPYTIVWGGLTSVPHSLRADLFGRRNFASIQGVMAPIQLPFNLVAPIFVAWVFERTGSFQIPLTLFSVLTFISMVMILLARPVERPTGLQSR